MSRLNPFSLPVLGRSLRPTAALNLPLRSQLAAPQRSLSSRIYTQTASNFRSSRGNPRVSFRWHAAFGQTARRGFRTSWRRANKEGSKAQEELSFGARMKKLTKEYGWVTVGVYLGLSVLDLPFCFLLVRVAGPDRIGELEHVITSNVGRFIPESVKTAYSNTRDAVKGLYSKSNPDEEVAADWGVAKAQDANQGAEASLVTQLALAYAIHKSFFFVRVPLTAAVTPKVVKVLRSWGWQIGKKKPKA